MKGIKIMMIVAGVAAFILLYLAVNVIVQSIKVQRERPLKIEPQQQQTEQVDYDSRRMQRR